MIRVPTDGTSLDARDSPDGSQDCT